MHRGMPRKMPSAMRMTAPIEMNESSGAAGIAVAATKRMSTTGIPTRESNDLAISHRRRDRILPNSETVRERDRVMCNPAHQLGSVGSMVGERLSQRNTTGRTEIVL